MRVLYVIPSLAERTGGPAVVAVEAARALRRFGVDVDIFTTDLGGPAGSGYRHRAAADADLVQGARESGAIRFPARRPYRFAFSPELRRALRTEAHRYDLVHVHSLFLFPQFEAGRAARRAAVPYVVSPHGSLDPWLRRRGRLRKRVTDAAWQRRLLGNAAALHVTSREEARLIADVAPSVPRIVVPIGIDWAHYQSLPDPDEFRRKFIGAADGPIVLNIGRVARKKGLDILVRAFGALSAKRPDAQLAIVGPDDERLIPTLRTIAADHGAVDRVHFTGLLRGQEKLRALAAASVWVLPSHTENFGLAVFEALAAGVPTVVSPAVNVADEMRAAGAAVICANDHEALASVLDRLLADAATRDALAARGREFARRYDWSEVAPLLADAYREVLDG